MLRELLRRVDMMVILENKLDALVRLHTPWPPGLIGSAYQYDIAEQSAPGIAVRSERGSHRSADSGGLRDHRLRSGVQLECGLHPLRLGAVAYADHDPRARPAVLAGLPRRAGQGRRASENRFGL